MTAAGCSLPLDTMFENSAADGDQTSSVALKDRLDQAATPSEADLAYARAVAADALARGSKDSSFPWENPHNGAGGNITPLAASYSEGVLFCRDFLASYVHGQAQAWLKGEACRSQHGSMGSEEPEAAQTGLNISSSTHRRSVTAGIALRDGDLSPTLGPWAGGASPKT